MNNYETLKVYFDLVRANRQQEGHPYDEAGAYAVGYVLSTIGYMMTDGQNEMLVKKIEQLAPSRTLRYMADGTPFLGDPEEVNA